MNSCSGNRMALIHFAIILGLINCTGIILMNVSCLIAGVWQMLAGFIVIVCEAPCCCFFIDYVQTLSDRIETRPYWNKAALYIGLALPPFFLCFLSMSTWFGSGLIFATGIIYGMMALGKKGSRDDMAAMAAAGSPPGAPALDHSATLMEDPDVWRASIDDMRTSAANLEAGQPTTAPRANLVTNEQPFSITGPPAY
ncbi:calcium channel flower [Melitaea cinxia]|uniref:calcium channel flower n=1 Tax=Melitaea cinxia TaxID=113334 RepID=UPI001E272C6F|nr:calcium channel flower [Melitaea cinxia]